MTDAANAYILMPDHMRFRFAVEIVDYEDALDFDVRERQRCDSFAERHGFSLSDAHDANVREFVFRSRREEEASL